MTCEEVARRLDDETPGATDREARLLEHASGCKACADLLRAQRQVDRILAHAGAAPLQNPERFVDQVMQRVLQSERESPRFQWQTAAPLPWWVEAAADPAAVLACVLMALVLWKPAAIATIVQAATGWRIPAWLPTAWARSIVDLNRPSTALGLQIVGGLFLAWASLHLYRWTERLARRATRV
jgi:hypothetical protein